MPIIADCQSCGRKLRVPDELFGRKVKCPTCGQEFEARDEPPSAPPAIDLGDGVAGTADERPRRVEIERRDFESSYAHVRRDCEPDRGGMILTLGIVGLVVGLVVPLVGPIMGIVAWVMAVRDLRKMRQGQMDPQAMSSTQAGMICGIIGTAVGGLVSFCCISYIALIAVAVSVPPSPPPPRPVPVPKKVLMVAPLPVAVFSRG